MLSHYMGGAGLLLAGTHVAGFFCGLAQDRAAQRVVAGLTALDISDAEIGATPSAALVDMVTLLLHTAVSLRSFSAVGLQSIAGKRSACTVGLPSLQRDSHRLHPDPAIFR